MVFPGLQGGPHMNNIAAKAVAFGEAHSSSIQRLRGADIEERQGNGGGLQEK